MRHLQRGCMRKQMIVDPAREEGGFHRRRPRLWESLHPSVQIESRCRNRAFCMNLTTCILHAVADRFLVNIQADVIHTLHGGASLVASESARSLSSAFVHQALLLTHTFKQSVRNLVCSLPERHFGPVTANFKRCSAEISVSPAISP